MQFKPIINSKTFWVNVITLAISLFGGQFGVDVPPEIALPILGVLNILLRLITTEPVSLNGR